MMIMIINLPARHQICIQQVCKKETETEQNVLDIPLLSAKEKTKHELERHSSAICLCDLF